MDVLICTDVTGHGLNFPADVVIFTKTEKYDGVVRRPLHEWEVVQKAGSSEYCAKVIIFHHALK